MDSPSPPHQPQQLSPRPRAIVEIAEWLRLIIGENPSAVFEIRALGCSIPGYRQTRTMGGYFQSSQIDAAATAAANLTMPITRGGRESQAVYITLNPISPALLSRRTNRVDVYSPKDSTTSDVDITSRHWLLIDCDPLRPSGISSSEPEHAAAHQQALAVRSHLTAAGWPMPIVADSGNGWHLLYRIDLPNDEAATLTIQRCLHALAARFPKESTNVDIDTSVYNASRICKLYGTYSRKGDHTDDRPHRRSRIVEVPIDDPEIVHVDLLQILAAEAPAKIINPKTGKATSPARGSPIHRAEKWLEKRRPSISQQKGHNNAFYTACVVIRGYGLSIEEATPLMQAWNQYCEPPWSDRELMHKIREANEKADGEHGYIINKKSIPELIRGFLGDSMTIDLTGFSDFLPENQLKKNVTAWSQVRSGSISFLNEV